MKRKNGFTLTELLVVIAIIAVIVVIAVPSIIAVRKNMNARMYSKKIELIENAAELYGLNNPDVFNATNEEYVTVEDLIKGGFLEPDAAKGSGNCTSDDGCIIDPRCDDDNGCKVPMNDIQVLITKESAGVSAKIGGVKCDNNDPNNKCMGGTLVQQVCEKFNGNKYVGKYGTGAEDYCGCRMENGLPVSINKIVRREGNTIVFGDAVKACIISGDEKNNYLKYNGVMWRVMGVYDLSDNVTPNLSAKIITNDTVDVN